MMALNTGHGLPSRQNEKNVSQDVNYASLMAGAMGKGKLYVNWPIRLEIK
jgi:hypothetical protein